MKQSSYLVTVRFPSGTEFWQTETLPEIGSTISRSGREYLIVSCEQLQDGAFALNVAEMETNEVPEPAFA